MFHKLFTFATLLFFLGRPSEENAKYHKEYYESGKTKAEGWVQKGVKTGYWKFYDIDGNVSEKGHYTSGKRENYWYFYRTNGIRSKEGHYYNGQKTDWWLYYNEFGKLDYKCQLNIGIKNGYCLRYVKGQISSAIKYNRGKKIKEWHDLRSFKRENKLSDLK
jgi:antitoxin component YwqK of YwqJK toxin-antitoxin module